MNADFPTINGTFVSPFPRFTESHKTCVGGWQTIRAGRSRGAVWFSYFWACYGCCTRVQQLSMLALIFTFALSILCHWSGGLMKSTTHLYVDDDWSESEMHFFPVVVATSNVLMNLSTNLHTCFVKSPNETHWHNINKRKRKKKWVESSLTGERKVLLGVEEDKEVKSNKNTFCICKKV